jgi:hypothetical protein
MFIAGDQTLKVMVIVDRETSIYVSAIFCNINDHPTYTRYYFLTTLISIMYKNNHLTQAKSITPSEQYDNSASESESTEHQEMTIIDKLVAQAVSTYLKSAITTKVDLSEDKRRPAWKQAVMDHFTDAWEELNTAEIWNRLNFLAALFGKDKVSWQSAQNFLEQDIVEVAEDLKDFVIDQVMQGDYTNRDDDARPGDDSDSEGSDFSDDTLDDDEDDDSMDESDE